MVVVENCCEGDVVVGLLQKLRNEKSDLFGGRSLSSSLLFFCSTVSAATR
jgi:hypothetical protein